jgi:hypothetical protein
MPSEKELATPLEGNQAASLKEGLAIPRTRMPDVTQDNPLTPTMPQGATYSFYAQRRLVVTSGVSHAMFKKTIYLYLF